jgi:hypothetical protein
MTTREMVCINPECSVTTYEATVIHERTGKESSSTITPCPECRQPGAAKVEP